MQARSDLENPGFLHLKKLNIKNALMNNLLSINIGNPSSSSHAFKPTVLTRF